MLLNDSMVQLAFTVYKNPGVTALLLGSGISRSARVPTGWEVVNDLIRQLAAVHGESQIDDPVKWFKDKFGVDPGYDALVEALGKTSFERNMLLRRYFEPTDDEREKGTKMPTSAHRSIARLMKRSYIRLILTTNFDRLLELALEDEGIRPQVISTNEQLKGMQPIQHAGPTVVKLHGDYMDGAFKNTAAELAAYTPEMEHFLDRVFDEYGLVVCGWSGEWDAALRQAIERVIQRRYTVFWSSCSKPDNGSAAQKLIDHREAILIPNMDADQFFGNLQNMVDALEAANRPDPLSVTIAVQYVKKLIPDRGSQVELEDFIRRQYEQAYQTFTSAEFIIKRGGVIAGAVEPVERFKAIWDAYFAATELPISTIAAVAWYGNEAHARLVTEAMERWLEIVPTWEHDEKFRLWRFLPALSLLYTVGIASSGNSKWAFLPALLKYPRARLFSGQEAVVTQVLGDDAILEGLLRGSDIERYSIFISEWLRPVFRTYLPSDTAYKRAFHLFDMLWSLVYLDQHPHEDKSWAPGFSLKFDASSQEYLKGIWAQAGSQGKAWPLLAQGLFDANTQNVYEALQQYTNFVQTLRRSTHLDRFPDYAQIYQDDRPDVLRSGSISIPRR